MNAYTHGFVYKCAQLRVDPKAIFGNTDITGGVHTPGATNITGVSRSPSYETDLKSRKQSISPETLKRISSLGASLMFRRYANDNLGSGPKFVFSKSWSF